MNWDSLTLYQSMVRIRLVENGIIDRYPAEEMRCPVHLSIGQEAAAVGVCAALRPGDRVFSTHRCHAHYLAKGGDLKRMLAEIYGKAAGCVGGRGGSMHLQDPGAGVIASIPIVGSSIPVAVGAALADHLDGKDHVTAAFFGDAAIEEGVFHESANFAVLRGLPIVFVCENNLYSVYTPLHERQPSRPLTEVARAHGMRTFEADGNDVETVAAVATEAADAARSGRGPSFLLLPTYRWREHCGVRFDNHLGYRTEQEFLDWKARDPLQVQAARLRSRGLVDAEAERRLTEALAMEIDAAFAWAQAAVLPTPDQAREHIYA